MLTDVMLLLSTGCVSSAQNPWFTTSTIDRRFQL